jgi:hypothetical protein
VIAFGGSSIDTTVSLTHNLVDRVFVRAGLQEDFHDGCEVVRRSQSNRACIVLSDEEVTLGPRSKNQIDSQRLIFKKNGREKECHYETVVETNRQELSL